MDVYPVGVRGPDRRPLAANGRLLTTSTGDTLIVTWRHKRPWLAFYVPGATPQERKPGEWSLTMDTGEYTVVRLPLTCGCQNLPHRLLPAAELLALAPQPEPSPVVMAPPGGDGPVLDGPAVTP